MNQGPTEIWCTLAGSVDGLMAQRVFQFFANAVNNGVKDVHLLLQSSGGFIPDGVGIYNYLSNVPINIITYNGGGVSSTAVTVFLSGKKRIANETSTFVIHKTQGFPPAGAPATVLKAVVDSLDIDDSRTESILRKHTKMPEEKWLLHQHGTLVITAQEALKFGIVHEIGAFSPPPTGPLWNM
jgi:ATP-dependent Clp protease protease subunit